MSRSRLVSPVTYLLLFGLPLLAASPVPAERAASAVVESQRLPPPASGVLDSFSAPCRLPPVPQLPSAAPRRIPLDPESASDELQRLSSRVRDLERALSANKARSGEPGSALVRSLDLQGALQPLELRSEAVEGQISALEQRFAGLDAGLGQVDQQLKQADQQLDGTAKQLAELEQKLDEKSKSLDKVLDPSWVTQNLPDWLNEGFKLGMYLRAGYGVNGRGGGIEEFAVPDNLFEIVWRLGNEKDTYGELWFQQRFNQREPDKPQVLVWTDLAFKYRSDKTNYSVDEDADILVRETYVEVTKVLEGHPEVGFWIGERFYDRHDIHITDLFALDNSGWGGGVRDVDLDFGKLWVAYLGGTRDQFKDYGGVGTLTEQHLDLRIKGIETFKGKTMLWLDFAWVPGGNYTDFGIANRSVTGVGDQDLSGDLRMITYDEVRFETEAGLAIGIVDERDLLGGFNKLFVMYGFGAAADFNTYIVVGKPPGAVGDQERFFAANWFVKSVNDWLHYMVAFTFDDENVGQGHDGTYGYGFSQPKRRLYSAGVRPIFMFTETLALQFETGIDYVDEIRYTAKSGDNAYCAKFTVAPTIRTVSSLGKVKPDEFPRPNFWSRPELRLFATYAWWSSSARGLVGAPAYQEQTDGWSFGVQAETWW